MTTAQSELKQLVGNSIAARIKDGDLLGVGTGSTVDAALDALAARRVQERLAVSVLPTSLETALRCQALGLTVLSSNYRGELSWGFDGADELDRRLRVIKGKGGALLTEKLVAARCKKFVIVVDQSKVVERLGERTAIPVEVLVDAIGIAERGLAKIGATSITLRHCTGGKHGPVITERGNAILDAQFPEIADDLEPRIKSLVGVVESGLFVGYAHEALIASPQGIESWVR